MSTPDSGNGEVSRKRVKLLRSTRVVRQLAWPLFGLVVLFVVVAGGLLIISAQRQNHMALQESIQTASTTFSYLEREIRGVVHHHVDWSNHKLKANVPTDINWLKRHLSHALFDNFGITEIFVVGPDNEVLYSVQIDQGQAIHHPMAEVPVEAVSLVRSARMSPVSQQNAFSGFFYHHDMLHLGAAIALREPDMTATSVRSKRAVLMFLRRMDAATMRGLEQSYLLSNLQIVSGAIPRGYATLQLYSADGRQAALVAWQPAEPGSEMLRSLALPLVVATVLMIGLGLVIFRHGRLTARALDLTAADLAKRNAQLRASERAARQARLQAEMSNRTKSEFLATMSHELRTPLNAIIGFAEILEGELLGKLGNPSYKDYARDIHDSGAHLLELINDILDLSKAEAGKMELSEDAFDMREVTARCVAMLQPRAEETGVTLKNEVSPTLSLLYGDQRKLKQTMINLIANAIKFTPEGGSVTISTEVTKDGLAISIQDTGIGMERKDIKTALQPFGQIHSPLNRKQSGTGLGLAIVQSIVTLHGGRLELASEPGTGTRATVHLPKSRLLPEQECDSRDEAPADRGVA